MNQIARLSLVDRTDADLSIVAQCRLLKAARSTLYYRGAPTSADDLRLMRRLDEQFMATPFYGSRRMDASATIHDYLGCHFSRCYAISHCWLPGRKHPMATRNWLCGNNNAGRALPHQ